MATWMETARLAAASAIASALMGVAATADTGAGSSAARPWSRRHGRLLRPRLRQNGNSKRRRRRLSHDPSYVSWQHAVIMADQALGDLFVNDGDLADARQAYSDQLDDARRFVASDPRYTVRQWEVSVADEKIGDVMLAQHDIAGARGSL